MELPNSSTWLPFSSCSYSVDPVHKVGSAHQESHRAAEQTIPRNEADEADHARGSSFSWKGVPLVDDDDIDVSDADSTSLFEDGSETPTNPQSQLSHSGFSECDSVDSDSWLSEVCDYERRHAAEVIQLWWQTLLRNREWQKIDAAWQLQAWWRGLVCRRSYCQMRCTARILQQAWRQYCKRLNLRAELDRRVALRQNCAALRVQSFWRGALSRWQCGPEVKLMRQMKARRWFMLHKAKSMSSTSRSRLPNSPHSSPRSSLCSGTVSLANLASSRLSPRASPSSSSRELLHPRGEPSASSRSGKTGIPSTKITKPTSSPTSSPKPASPRALRPMVYPTRRGSSVAAAATSSNTGSVLASQSLDPDGLLVSMLASGLLCTAPKGSMNAAVSSLTDLEQVRAMLQDSLPSLRVCEVHRVQCAGSSLIAYDAVRSSLGPERLLWHGTAWESVANIAQHGFNRAYAFGSACRHGCRLGRGCYFAEDPTYALRFCGKHDGRKVLFLAGVLPGKVVRGSHGLIEPPIADSSGARFDCTVDDESRPRVFCVFRDFQAVPLYLAVVGG